MLTDPGSSIADHEARNEHLIDIDTAWELCRDEIDLARIAYEEALEASRSTYETKQATVAAAHHQALDGAWATYKQQVTDSPAVGRREAIVQARAKYNQAAATVRQTFDADMASAAEDYEHSLHEARSAYDSFVVQAIEAHREAMQGVQRFHETSSDDADDAVDHLAAAGAAAARGTAGHQPAAQVKNLTAGTDELADSVLAGLNGNGS